MASSDVLTHTYDVRSLTMKGDKLKIQGTGITPRVTTPTPTTSTSNGLQVPSPGVLDSASRSSVTSDDDVTRSVDDEEADSMLQGVVSMNQILEGQIEALRLRLHVEDKQHREDKNKLRQEKDSVIRTKETEISELKDSLVNREERISSLVKASEDKDLTIQNKVKEIEDLKKMVKESEDYAHKLHRQIGHVRHKKQVLESDTLYQEQNEEISRLNDELRALKDRLGSMETELKRATKIMEQQTARIQQLENERGSMQSKFKEELDKATRAMRQEVERMREVMRQNYEEMRMLRDQNRQMHCDVQDIKQMLMNGVKSSGGQSPLSPTSPSPRHLTGVQRPFTASRMNLIPADNLRASPTNTAARGTNMTGGSPHYLHGAASSSSKHVTTTTTTTAMGSRTAAGAASGVHHGALPLSPTAREPGRKSTIPAASAAASPTSGAGGGGGAGAKRTPTICGLKEGPGLPTISRQPSALQQARTKSAVRLSSGKLTGRK